MVNGMESVPSVLPKLHWYDRLNIAAEQKLGFGSSKGRVISIDFMKGISIFLIGYIHLMSDWLAVQDIWLWQLVYLFVEMWGPTTFLFFAGVNTTYSYRLKAIKGIHFKDAYLDTARRMLGLYVVALFQNVILNMYYQYSFSPLNFQFYFRWDILQALAFSVVILFPLLKLPNWFRLFLATFLYIFSYSLYLLLLSVSGDPLWASTLRILFFEPFTATPLFPKFADCLMGSVIIDFILISNAKGKQNLIKNTPQSPFLNTKHYSNGIFPSRELNKMLKILAFSAAVGLIVFVCIGLNQNDIIFLDEVVNIVTDKLYRNPVLQTIFPIIPVVLLKEHPINTVFKICYEIFLFALFFYYFDARASRKESMSFVTQNLAFMGNFSFSYFVYYAFFNLIPIDFGIYWIWPFVLIAMSILTLIFRWDLIYHHGIAMIEYVIIIFTINWSKDPPEKEIRRFLDIKASRAKKHLPSNN